MHCYNKVVLELPCCTCELLVYIGLNRSAIYYILVTVGVLILALKTHDISFKPQKEALIRVKAWHTKNVAEDLFQALH